MGIGVSLGEDGSSARNAGKQRCHMAAFGVPPTTCHYRWACASGRHRPTYHAYFRPNSLARGPGFPCCGS